MSSDANTNAFDIVRWVLLVPMWVAVWFFVPYAYYKIFGVGAVRWHRHTRTYSRFLRWFVRYCLVCICITLCRIWHIKIVYHDMF